MQNPIVVSDNFWSQLLTNELLNASTVTFSGVLAGLKAGLLIVDPHATEETQYSDLTVPTYTGYALKTITWNPPARNADGSWGVAGNVQQFQMGDATTPTTCVGYFVCLPGTPNVLEWSQIFDVSIQLNTVNDACAFVPAISFGPTTTASAIVV